MVEDEQPERDDAEPVEVVAAVVSGRAPLALLRRGSPRPATLAPRPAACRDEQGATRPTATKTDEWIGPAKWQSGQLRSPWSASWSLRERHLRHHRGRVRTERAGLWEAASAIVLIGIAPFVGMAMPLGTRGDGLSALIHLVSRSIRLVHPNPVRREAAYWAVGGRYGSSTTASRSRCSRMA
jgi:hypothetical protein